MMIITIMTHDCGRGGVVGCGVWRAQVGGEELCGMIM